MITGILSASHNVYFVLDWKYKLYRIKIYAHIFFCTNKTLKTKRELKKMT